MIEAHIIYLQMCVDDYQFRHQSATRQKECKRFIFQNKDGNERVFLVNISQFEIFGNLRLCQILIHLSKKGLSTKNHSFYMPQLQITIESGDQCIIPFQRLSFKDVFFIMNEISEEQSYNMEECLFEYHQFSNTNENQRLIGGDGMEMDQCSSKDACSQGKSTTHDGQIKQLSHQDMNEESSHSHQSERKQKNQEKTIFEALTKIKQWRFLHEIANISLKNSAGFVGLSKKTLDDYFLVIRIGEELRYDFQANLGEKIGHLRHFIRNHPIKIQGRLPKIVRSFNLIPEPSINKLIPGFKLDKLEFIEEYK